MPTLLLGPVLRHVSDRTATVWVETDRRCRVRVTCASGAGGAARSFMVEGHWYALVLVSGLQPGATTYTVDLDDERAWPEATPPFEGAPPSVIRTLQPTGPRRITFGSCRVASPDLEGPDPLGVDALDAFAGRLAATLREAGPDGAQDALPDLLLMLGDQVYADGVSDDTQEKIVARRGMAPPERQVADFEEYTWLYTESWRDGPIRWLLSTVPVAMIFDDHDLHDDWNTSAAWRRAMAAQPWWAERLVGGLMSYWVYQHVGNLSPEELAADEVFQRVCEFAETGADCSGFLREFARAADDAVAAGTGGYRWSFWRDLGPVRLVVLDSRCGRVLVDGERSMLADSTFDWLAERLDGDYAHLALGTSLPWLLNPAMQAAEAWNERLTERGRVRAFVGEKLRVGVDLEHWAAFGISFERLADALRTVATRRQPSTITVLSGDVHHSYVTEVDLGVPTPTRTWQVTCSPVHNELPTLLRAVFRLAWRPGATRFAQLVFHRVLRVPRLSVRWRSVAGPIFTNCIATVRYDEGQAGVVLEAGQDDGDGPYLRTAAERSL